jgi:hypothetical protein
MRAQEFILEAFDQPYKSKWEKTEYGDVDVLAKLPDGSPLSIMFNQQQDDEGNQAVQVEFYRNNSQEVTGEGDAQRIFATVLSAIQKYIKKYKPQRLTFSASKETDPTVYYEPDEPQPNPESRAKLYDRLVQRYARSWGYRAFRADNGNLVIYELNRINKGVAEAQEKFNRAIMQPGFEFRQEINGVTYEVTNDQGFGPVVTVTDNNNEVIAQAGFWKHKTRPGLESLSTHVEPEWQGQGIAANMYAVMRMLGANISPSTNQTDDGRAMWKKWHQQGDAKHIKNLNPKIKEQGVTENFADGKKPGRKGLAKRVGVDCKQSVSKLRSIAAHSSGEKQRMAHWCANMKSGKKK